MHARLVIHALIVSLALIIFAACHTNSTSPDAKTVIDASDASQIVPDTSEPVRETTPPPEEDTITPPSEPSPVSYPEISYIKSCPPGIEESKTIVCPTIALTAEQVENMERASNANRQYSANCPSGMREVVGNYCTQLEHVCIKGRDNTLVYKDTKTGKDMVSVIKDYFCDQYAVGSAKCTGPEKQLHACVDEYEYPNIPGKNPVIMTSWYDAHRICKSEGKRLCTDEEWTLACEGPDRKPYPYGWERDSKACNIDNKGRRDDQTDQKLFQGGDIRKAELARLWNARPLAASPHCVSDYGVYDMAGNVDEVTDNVSRGGRPYKDLWKGGHWVGGARNRCRPYTDGHDEGFGYYANGFRCCADPTNTTSPK